MIELLNEQLTVIRGKIRHKQKLEKDRRQIKETLAAERAKYAGLKKQLSREGRDVKKLEGLSLSGLFLSILGNKEAQLEKERQEFLAAKLKYDGCRSTIETLDEQERTIAAQWGSLGAPEERYRELLAQKEAVILAAKSSRARPLLEISGELDELQANQKELKEALEAGNQARVLLQKVQESLDSAHGWGVWDMLGGGLLATAVKHARIDDARQHVHHAQQALHRFGRELKDVNPHLLTAITIDIGGFATFADYFFDGLIVDWIVQSRINDSLKNVNNILERVNTILRELQQELRSTQDRLAAGYEKKQNIIEAYQKER